MDNQKLINVLIESERDLSDMKFRMDVMQETLFEVRRELEGVQIHETPNDSSFDDIVLDDELDQCQSTDGCSSCGTV